MSGNSFFAELRQRKVVQVAAIYGALAWGITEVLVTVVEQSFLPQWSETFERGPRLTARMLAAPGRAVGLNPNNLEALQNYARSRWLDTRYPVS